MLLLLSLLACTEDTRGISGLVQDIWGAPVPEATVVVEGVMDRYYTDSEGRFEIDVPVSKLTLRTAEEGEDPALSPVGIRVLAGKDGFIKEVSLARELPEQDDFEPVSLGLYPEPATTGFFGVGRSAYVTLGKQRIQVVGTGLEHFAGIQNIPEEALPSGQVRIVFNTRLRPSEIAQMNLHLSRLEFVNKADVKGIFGAQESAVNLWVAKEDVPFDIESFATREDYLVTSRGPLEPGMYAFHAHDVLHEEDERVLRTLPKEQMYAFPFEIR